MAESELVDRLDASQETALREYFAAQLDGHVGHAETAFWKHLAEEKQMPPRPFALRLPNRFGGWMLSAAGVALAASLGALWAGPSLVRVTSQRPSLAAPAVSTPVSAPTYIERDVHSQTFDDGTYLFDGSTPVRVLRRRDTERTRWFDHDRKLQDERETPQDHVIYVPVKTY